MNRVQKMAWYTVICISTAVVISLIAVAVLYYLVGMPMSRSLGGFGFLGITGFSGFAQLIFPKDKGKVDCDERDVEINRKAALVSFLAAYLVTGLSCMLPFFILGYNATISVVWLPFIFMAAGLISYVVHAVVILEEYGRGNKGENTNE